MIDRRRAQSGYIYSMLWGIYFFVSTEGIGLRGESWGGLGAGSMGWFMMLQVGLALLLLACIPAATAVMLRNLNGALAKVMLLFFSLPIYIVVISAARGLVLQEVNLSDYFRNLLFLKSLFTFYFCIYFLSTETKLSAALSQLEIWAVLASVSALTLSFFNQNTDVFKIVRSDFDVVRSYRILMPQAALCAVGWLWFHSRYFCSSSRLRDGLLGTICLIAVLVQMHRGVLMSVIFACVGLFLFWFSTKATSSMTRISRAVLVALVTFSLVIIVSETIVTVLQATVGELRGDAYQFSSALHRFVLIANTLKNVNDQTAGLGFGLDWELYTLQQLVTSSYVQSPTLDSTIANLLLISGIPGLFLGVALAVLSLRACWTMTSTKSPELHYRCFLTLSMVYFFMNSFTTDIIYLGAYPPIFFFALGVIFMKKNNSELWRK